ncbi:hypothetical protein DN402_20050 [Streptomyces sp. SW4]|nr:hypothetical protein DN402_20050 [Streptomyces sp. SW4]
MAATALATALGTALALPASAHATQGQDGAAGAAGAAGEAGAAGAAGTGTRGAVEFSLIDTGAGIPRDGTFRLGDLTEYGIPRQTTEKLAAGERVGEPAPAATTAAAPDYTIVPGGEWKDRDGWDAVMRQGWWNGANGGFGMTKIDQKHNLSLDAVKATTMYPRPGPSGKEQIGPSTYNYRTEALRVQCSGWWIFRTCRVTEVMTVRAGIDYRKLDDGKSFGAVTAFCEGVPGRCPDWVRNSINI